MGYLWPLNEAQALSAHVFMANKKRTHPKEKLELHPRNQHRERYNFKDLVKSCPDLAPYVILNAYQDESIDFFNPEAVKMLNTALLKKYYDLKYWDIPANYLCPPIPGRADYVHHVADLLGEKNKGKIPLGHDIYCLDIGVGANCVYPIIGHKEYGWSFVGSDIDAIAVDSASRIVEKNPSMSQRIEIRQQPNPLDIFKGIIKKDEKFDLTICNPPFHASAAESESATLRKLSNLKSQKINKPELNFGGRNNELWREGGEEKFVKDMIQQSREFSASCFWFSTLISKQSNLKKAYQELDNKGALEWKAIPMAQGNKISRVLAWTFLSKEEQKQWIDSRWG